MFNTPTITRFTTQGRNYNSIAAFQISGQGNKYSIFLDSELTGGSIESLQSFLISQDITHVVQKDVRSELGKPEKVDFHGVIFTAERIEGNSISGGGRFDTFQIENNRVRITTYVNERQIELWKEY